jgi:flavin-binding protein dodecin
MTEHVYKHIELTGSSPDGFESAIARARERAGESVRQMRWFEVTDTRGFVVEGKIAFWQVTIKVGFTIED